MKKLLFIIAFTITFTGCLKSQIQYNSPVINNIEQYQYIEYKECTNLIGPFNIGDKLDLQTTIQHAIDKANNQGMYGDNIANIIVDEDIFTLIIYTKLCISVKGNIIK